MHKHEKVRRARREYYVLIIGVTLCLIAGRICSITSKEGDTAFQSANDRSRWCTVAALVEDGTYQIDRLVNFTNEKKRRPWYTIDMVRHRGEDGKLHYYSSKPPLFPTMVAGVYWFVHQFDGLSMTEQPIYVPRLILLLVNLPMMGVFLWYLIACIEMIGQGEWSRRFTATAACFGTMLTAFAVTLNNHLPAAMAMAIVCYLYMKAADKLLEEEPFELRDLPLQYWVLAGLAAGFAVANELPALSMTVGWIYLVHKLSKRAVAPFVGGVAVVAIAFFATNFIAHSSLRPAYAHRSDGEQVATIPSQQQPSNETIQNTLADAGVIGASTTISITTSGEADRWAVQSDQDDLFSLRQAPGSDQWSLNHWGDWYDYPGSYWDDGKRKGVDLGEPSRIVYLFNMLFGYYGIFAITPLWVLLPQGFYRSTRRGPRDFRRLAGVIAASTLVCILFYLFRPTIDRNYGGVSACFRWMLWFTPLWFVVITPTIDELAVAQKRRAALLALACAGVFSMSFALETPWQSPWIYQLWQFWTG